MAGIGASIAALGLPRAAQAPKRVRSDAADRLHQFSPVRREVQRLARGASPRSSRAGGSRRSRRETQVAPEGRAHDRLRRPRRHAGTDRRALALHVSPRCRSRACFAADIGYIFLAASAEAERTLMRGFTTVRDLGGPSFRAQAGDRRGPCAGAAHLSVRRDDHHDRRPWRSASAARTCRAAPGGPVSHMEETGGAMIADSADEVRLRVREQLLQGASQIKLVGGGGVSSPRTTLDMTTFSEPGVARRRRGRARPEHLRRGARLSARRHPAGDRRGRRSASSTRTSWTRRRRS